MNAYHKKHHANIAVISGDSDFEHVCLDRRHFSYYKHLDPYLKAFEPELSEKRMLPNDVPITGLATTEDLTELKAILGRGGEVTPIEVNRTMQLLEPKGTN